MLLGLRTVIYAAPDLARAKAFYSELLGIDPYFAEPFYIGFSVSGYELGLDPDAETPTGPGGATAYWGVADIEEAMRHLQSVGATGAAAINDVGEGIRVAVLSDPFGNALGVIQNPHFKAS